MKTPFILRRAFQAMIPAVLLLASCGKDDDPATPAPDQGRVTFVNAAAGVGATVAVKYSVNTVEKAQLTYGQASGYQGIDVGAPVFKTTVASSGQAINEDAGIIAKNGSYSYFLYNITPTTYGSLLKTDDLTAPTSGKAKIRLVHLGNGISTSINLSTVLPVGYAAIISSVNFGSASDFIEVNPGPFSMAITTGTSMNPLAGLQVGDGTGTGTGTKTLVAGKIYTVLVRGVDTLFDPALKAKVFVYVNN